LDAIKKLVLLVYKKVFCRIL